MPISSCGDRLHRADVVVHVGCVDEGRAAVDELVGQRGRSEGRVGLDRAALADLLGGEGADIALAVGVLQHRAFDEAVLDGLDDHLVMVDADHLDALVADAAERVRGDHRRHPGRRDDAVDIRGLGGEIGVDLLLGRFRRVDVGDDLDHFHAVTRLVRRPLDRVDAQLRVGIDEEPGEMRDAPLPAHRADQLLGAEIGRVAGVGPEAELVVRRLLETARERDHGRALAGELTHDGDAAHGIAREDQERVVALGQQALEKFVLLAQFPLLRHAVIRAGGAELGGGIRAGLFPGGEIRMRPARHERDLGALGMGRERQRRHESGGRDAAHEFS